MITKTLAFPGAMMSQFPVPSCVLVTLDPPMHTDAEFSGFAVTVTIFAAAADGNCTRVPVVAILTWFVPIEAAGVLGINLPKAKLAALVASAMIAGLAGAFNAHTTSFIGPNEYGFEPAVTILSFALLGGIGTPLAPVLGAWILTLLPELLRGFSDLRLVFNGVIIVLAVMFLPNGLLSWRMRRRAA